MSQPTRIEPPVGRVVLYYPSDDDIYYARISCVKGKPLSAMVAWVNEDETINLAVNDMNGYNIAIKRVTLIQPGEQPPDRTKTKSYATWMPYQVGQAAKTEAAYEKMAALSGGDGRGLKDFVEAEVVKSHVTSDNVARSSDQGLTSYGDLGHKAPEPITNRHAFHDKPAMPRDGIG